MAKICKVSLLNDTVQIFKEQDVTFTLPANRNYSSADLEVFTSGGRINITVGGFSGSFSSFLHSLISVDKYVCM